VRRRLLLLHPANLGGENHGVFIHHVASMQWLLSPEGGWEVVALDPFHPALPEAAATSDLVVVHMLPNREVEALVRLRRARGLPTVFEISDNFLGLGDWLPARHGLRSPLVRQNILLHASLCDALQVYAPGLEELFRRVNARIAVFDPYVPIADTVTRTSDELVVGWGGTTSHEHDLARVASAITEFCRRHADVVFAFMGDPAMFARLFADIPARQARVRPFGDHESYLGFVRELHVGLAPLADSSFNGARADTKFATYAACGAAPVLESAPVYRAHADHALLFRTTTELGEILEALHADRARVADLARRAHAWVTENRGAARLRAQREAFYRSLLPVGGPRSHRPPMIGSAPPAAARLTAVSVKDRPEEALAIASGAAREHPAYAQAHWIVACSLQALGRHREALDYLQATPWPPLYDELVAQMLVRLARRVRPGDVGRHVARITSPLVHLRLQYRDKKDLDAFHRAVLEHHPYDYFALSAVIRRLLRADPGSPELAGLFERLCLLAPETVARERRPPRLAPFLPT
jgi:hypothetical protein